MQVQGTLAALALAPAHPAAGLHGLLPSPCLPSLRRYTKQITLTNTSAIPLVYIWRLSDASGAGSGGAAIPRGPSAAASPSCREFSVIPSKGTVLPGGAQQVLIEFMPQVGTG